MVDYKCLSSTLWLDRDQGQDSHLAGIGKTPPPQMFKEQGSISIGSGRGKTTWDLPSMRVEWSGRVEQVGRIWFEGSTSSHDALKRSGQGFIGPGVYLGKKDLARRYAGEGGALRKVKVKGNASVVEIDQRYSEDLLRLMEEEGAEDGFEVLGVDAILVTGRNGGKELVLRDPVLGRILEEVRI